MYQGIDTFEEAQRTMYHSGNTFTFDLKRRKHDRQRVYSARMSDNNTENLGVFRQLQFAIGLR